MNPPKFFLAVFGDPRPPGKNTVESGEYRPIARYRLSEIRTGDLMLLYCTLMYPGHSMKIPGVGVVLDKDNELVRYRWLPFREAIAESRTHKTFTADDRKKFRNKRLASQQLCEISSDSFLGTVENQQIDWSSVSGRTPKVLSLPKKSA